MKEIKSWIYIGLIGAFFVALIIFRSDLVEAISNSQRNSMPVSQAESTAMQISKQFDYSTSDSGYTSTFLEFGSAGCSACKQMESVMEQVKEQYAGKVNVVFVNVTKKDNEHLIQYYGIVTIPTQVLLDKNAKEYFRHNGYISSEDLIQQFK